MDFFEKEMRQMFGDNGIFQDAKFVGKTMLAKLDDLRSSLPIPCVGYVVNAGNGKHITERCLNACSCITY